jgi:hypothetical protein
MVPKNDEAAESMGRSRSQHLQRIAASVTWRLRLLGQ